MLTDSNYTYCGQAHFRMYVIAESLYCTSETNLILYTNSTSV